MILQLSLMVNVELRSLAHRVTLYLPDQKNDVRIIYGGEMGVLVVFDLFSSVVLFVDQLFVFPLSARRVDFGAFAGTKAISVYVVT